MTNQESREVLYFKIPVFLVDLTIHYGVLIFLVNRMTQSEAVRQIASNDRWSLTLFGLIAVSFLVTMNWIGLRLHERRIKMRVVLWRAICQTLVTYIIFFTLIGLVFKSVPRQLVLSELLIVIPAITLWHYAANKAVRLLRKRGKNIRNVIFIGMDETNKLLYEELCQGRSFTGYRVQGFFSSLEGAEVPEGCEHLGTIHDFFTWAEHNRVDEIYCSLPPKQNHKSINEIIKICNEKLMEFFFVPNLDGYPKRQLSFRNIGKVNFIKLREEPMNNAISKKVKRLEDILISGVFLCTIYPFVVLFVWAGNKITGNVGPLYFRQARTGYNGKSFYIYKFRSMKVNADADKLQATKDDPRKTPFGDFLRKSSIDELPQFINVFKGDMSIIGPRPHMEYHTEMYSALIGDYMVRHLAKPGITGWAQINGCRGETKTVEEMQARVEHDIWYIENWSNLLDLEIFFKTIWQVLPGHDKQAY